MKRTEFNLDQFPIDKGFYVIEAGAGSGKTYNLVRIVLRLLCRANDPVSIQKILLVTFTEAAAMEMRQRLREILEDCLIGEKEDLIKTLNEGLGLKVNKKRIRKALDFLGSMQITTIHGFCLRAYNDHAVNSGFPPLPGDPINGADLVEEITNDFIRLYPKLQTKLTSIRHCVKALFSDINTKIPDKKYPNLREFVRSRKNQSEVITFDHLITSLRDALSKSNDEKSSKLAKFIRADYQACLIDESQDTDGLQWDIFNTLFGPDSKSDSHLLVMVGDPKQSIYGFRGADINSYLRARLKANRIYTLSENWRSSPKMIDAFNQFFTNPDFFTKSSDQKKSEESNSSKKIICDEIKVPASRSQFPELGKFPIEIIDSDQVEQVAKEALRLLDEFDDPEFNKKGEKSPGADANVGILVRSNSEADKIYRALIDLGLGASLESDKSVFVTTTAFQIQLLLRATLKPAHTGNRKALLLSRPALFGPNVNLDSELDNELADWLAKALVKWNKYGFASAWQHLTRTAPDTLQTIVESLAQSSFRNRSLMDLSHIGNY
jgi:exodeoxyribonuclease V beta subunit